MSEKAENIIPFDFENNAVRLVIQNDAPWFVAKDVCTILDISNPWDAVARLDEDERDDLGITDAIGRKQEMNVVSESGLYSLIFTSRKPEAKRFRKWVTSEVLPSIRKTGGYLIPKASERMQTSARLIGLQQQSWKLMMHLKVETNKETRQFLYAQLEAIAAEMDLPAPRLDALGRDAPDIPEAVSQFWAAYEALAELDIDLNHAIRPELIAVNLNEMLAAAKHEDIAMPTYMELRAALPLSRAPRFIERKVMHSRLKGKTARCYVFENLSPTAE